MSYPRKKIYFRRNKNGGEIFMGNDSCRLIAVNMLNAVDDPYTDDASFNFERWYESVYEAQVLLDNLVDLELEGVQKIIDKVRSDDEPDYIKDTEIRTWQNLYNSGKRYRRTGNGFTGKGDTVAALGLKYDDALEMDEKIARTKLQAEFDASIDMAITRGKFEDFDMETEDKSEFIQMLQVEFPDIYDRMSKYGRRNVSISTIAPTGSLSMLAKNGESFGVSGGIEPVFALWFTRRKKINPNENVEVDFVDDLGDKWQEFNVYHAGFREWGRVNGLTDLEQNIALSPYYKATAPEIDWKKRIKIQAIYQKYTTHSISSTLNLPETVTIDDVSDIYLNAWKHGLKGITIYRDGSRAGVLITKKEVERDSPKRPKNLPCRIFNTTRLGTNWLVLVGYLDGEPYELFAFENDRVKCDGGILKKKGGGVYDLICDDDVTIPDITSTRMTDETEAITRLISLNLREGRKIDHIVNQLSKSNGTIVNFSKVVSRTLRKLADVKITKGKKCPDCQSEMVMIEGCSTCPACGSSSCG